MCYARRSLSKHNDFLFFSFFLEGFYFLQYFGFFNLFFFGQWLFLLSVLFVH